MITHFVDTFTKRGVRQYALAKALGITASALNREMSREHATPSRRVPLLWAYRLAQYAADNLPEKGGVAFKYPHTWAPDHYHPKWKCQPKVVRKHAAKPVVETVTVEVSDEK